MSAVAEVRPLRKDAARNRELLLAAAADVFSELGLEAGVEEIARRAGVGMGTLYRRFPTKDALVDELAAHLLDDVLVAAASSAARTDGTAVQTFLTQVGEHFARRGGLLCRIWSVPTPAERVRELRSLLADVVAADQAAGTVRAGVAASDLSVTMFSIQGVIETAGKAAPTAWRRALDLALAGMLTAPQDFSTPALTSAELDAVRESRLS